MMMLYPSERSVAGAAPRIDVGGGFAYLMLAAVVCWLGLRTSTRRAGAASTAALREALRVVGPVRHADVPQPTVPV